MTLFNNFCAAILAVASSSRTAINDAARIIFGFFAAGTNAAVGFLPTIRRMKSATAFLAVAVAIPLMSACGSSSSGISATPPTPPIVPETTLERIINLVADDPGDITQPEASSGADFGTAGSDLPFPVNSTLSLSVDSALIRFASGNDYTYLYQQAAFSFTVTTTTPGTPGSSGTPATSYEFTAASFVVDASAGGTGCSQIGGLSGSGNFSCSSGVWTFTGWTGTIQAGATFNTLLFSTLASGTSPTAGSRTPRGGTPSTPSTSPRTTTVTTAISATVHVSEFDTEGTNAAVVSVVSALQTAVNAADDNTGFASATVTIAVKGARDISVTYLNMTTGVNEPRVVDAYLFETQYSALAWWIENPDTFLSSDAWAFDTRLLHFGLQTPASGARTGTATYSGIAAGQYLRDGGTLAIDRFVVGGRVTLDADFTANTGGISGTAELAAFRVTDLDAAVGAVTVSLTNPDSGTANNNNIVGATFSGSASIPTTNTATDGEFSDFRGNTGVGTFEGYFTGPRAEEAVGRVIVETTGDDTLEFGFLTREEPSGGGN